MARTYKRDIGGNTTARSEKAYKAYAHRQERHAVRVAVARGTEPMPKYYGDPWGGPKDGKGKYSAEYCAS